MSDNLDLAAIAAKVRDALVAAGSTFRPDKKDAYRRAIRWDSLNWQPWLGLGTLKATQAMWYRAPDPEANP